jgi:hypothetical protein
MEAAVETEPALERVRHRLIAGAEREDVLHPLALEREVAEGQNYPQPSFAKNKDLDALQFSSPSTFLLHELHKCVFSI